jgi:predicted transcriptional regulator
MPKLAMIKTSLKLPEDLWKRTKHKAIELDCDAQEIVARALEQFLKQGGRVK